MKGKRQPFGTFAKLLHPNAIQISIRTQTADNNTVRPQLLKHLDILSYHTKLCIRVQKISGSWTNKDIQLNITYFPYLLKLAHTRGRPAYEQIGTDFKAICACLLRNDCRLHRIDTYFQF